MSGEYVPMSQRTPEQQEAYRRSCRERNKRYYARRRKKRAETKKLREHFNYHGTVVCVECQVEEVVPICGFCKDGIASS